MPTKTTITHTHTYRYTYSASPTHTHTHTMIEHNSDTQVKKLTRNIYYPPQYNIIENLWRAKCMPRVVYVCVCGCALTHPRTHARTKRSHRRTPQLSPAAPQSPVFVCLCCQPPVPPSNPLSPTNHHLRLTPTHICNP